MGTCGPGDAGVALREKGESMKPETLDLLCSPGEHEPLRLDSVQGPNGRPEQVLVGVLMVPLWIVDSRPL